MKLTRVILIDVMLCLSMTGKVYPLHRDGTSDAAAAAAVPNAVSSYSTNVVVVGTAMTNDKTRHAFEQVGMLCYAQRG